LDFIQGAAPISEASAHHELLAISGRSLLMRIDSDQRDQVRICGCFCNPAQGAYPCPSLHYLGQQTPSGDFVAAAPAAVYPPGSPQPRSRDASASAARSGSVGGIPIAIHRVIYRLTPIRDGTSLTLHVCHNAANWHVRGTCQCAEAVLGSTCDGRTGFLVLGA
jgi:hypothetical protein